MLIIALAVSMPRVFCIFRAADTKKHSHIASAKKTSEVLELIYQLFLSGVNKRFKIKYLKITTLAWGIS